MTILLLGEEYPAAERLQRLLLQAAPGAAVAAHLDTVAGAVQWLQTHPAPDLILADIQLADGPSLDVFDQLVVGSPVIFTTAYDAYALRAFKANSVDYLLKPLKLSELQTALHKLRTWQRGPTSAGQAQQLERLLDGPPRPARPYKTRFLVRSGEQLLPLAATKP